MHNEAIDFVITWVDGNDPEWITEKEKYQRSLAGSSWKEWSSGSKRFRDWNLLRYWFRGVEKFAPWVNRIHFVTWGHYPNWLNINHPKLNIVRHADYIPIQYLPTFNSHTIELNFHRIPGLAEEFVYFNDDVFLVKPTNERDFFRHGLPCDFAALSPGYLDRHRTDYMPYDAMIINDHFNKTEVMKKRWWQWFNLRYGIKTNLRTLSLMGCRKFPGFQTNHLTMCFLKRTFETLWEKEFEELDKSCLDRFRGFYGIGPYLLRDWQRVSGSFVPCSPDHSAYLGVSALSSRDNESLVRAAIGRGKHKRICLNDECDSEEDFQFWSNVAHEAFESLLPTVSSFEVTP